jgi:aryl-alcohol dehydrogenase
VRIKAAGICHTELAFRDIELGTPLPMVLGHEGAGMIDAIGDGVSGFAIGDRVALSYNSCGFCQRCTDRQPQYCQEWPLRNVAGVTSAMQPPLTTADGRPLFGNFFGQSSFATYSIAFERNCVKIADALPFALAAPLGCGMQTGAGAVMNSLAGKAGQSLAVFGVGAVGMAAIMAAHAIGMAPIVAVDLVESRLDLAMQLGATHALRGDEALAKRLQAIAPAFDGVIDTTGVPTVLNTAIAALGPNGTAIVLAVSAPGVKAEFELSGFLSGKRIIGVVEGDADPQLFVPMLAAMHLAGRFPHDRLVKTYPFADINRAAEDMEQGRTIKPVLLFD